jgi:hypothetical protein
VVGVIVFSSLLGIVSSFASEGDPTAGVLSVIGLIVAAVISIAIVFVPYVWYTVATFRRGNEWMGIGLVIALLLTPLALGTACFAFFASL